MPSSRRLLLVMLASATIRCSDGARAPVPACAASTSVAEIAVSNISRVDLLLVISDAPSMAEEQTLLRTRLPQLMRSLLTGEVAGEPMFAPLQDLKVAVVAASLADGGDLHRAPADAAIGCSEQAPSFLRYRGPWFGPNRDDPTAFVDEFACLARVGNDARAPDQSLEAALRTLSDLQGDNGFLRNDPQSGLSAIEVVVITDTDDCSPGATASGSALESSVECAAQADGLQPVRHYVDGLRALRAGNENLVQLAVLAGVPPALTDDAAQHVDLSNDVARQAYYRKILDDPAMQIASAPGDGGLRPACTAEHASAEPARRLVEAARQFGQNGRVLSICSDDWRALLEPLLAWADQRADVLCLRRPLERAADARVACKLYWDLPAADRAPEGTPTRCSDRPYLSDAAGMPVEPGRRHCEMQQLAIADEATLAAADPNAGGWYYDDFSEATRARCVGESHAYVSFTENVGTPAGVVVTLECFAAQPLATGAADAGAADAVECRVPEYFTPDRIPSVATGGIGQACAPAFVPAGGFDDHEIYVETGADDCASGVCLVYRLRGDPRPDCVACAGLGQADCQQQPLWCATPEEIADRVYCSCRCDTGGSGTSACACPAGFSCQETFALGGPGYEGGYCVRDGTVESR
jgi:hypothetical protein